MLGFVLWPRFAVTASARRFRLRPEVGKPRVTRSWLGAAAPTSKKSAPSAVDLRTLSIDASADANDRRRGCR
jgi:hypothetical protein